MIACGKKLIHDPTRLVRVVKQAGRLNANSPFDRRLPPGDKFVRW